MTRSCQTIRETHSISLRQLRQRDRVAAGLTLTEVLVVITLMGLLVGGITPYVPGLMAKAQSQDVQSRLFESWRMARAYALAAQRPVLWELKPEGTGLKILICQSRTRAESLWSMHLPDCRLKQVIGAAKGEVADTWLVVVAPHGVTDDVTVELTQAEHSQTVALPGLLDQTPSSDGTGVGGTSQPRAAGSGGGAEP